MSKKGNTLWHLGALSEFVPGVPPPSGNNLRRSRPTHEAPHGEPAR